MVRYWWAHYNEGSNNQARCNHCDEIMATWTGVPTDGVPVGKRKLMNAHLETHDGVMLINLDAA